MTEQESAASETQEAAKPEALKAPEPTEASEVAESPEAPGAEVDSSDPLLVHPHLNALADFVREAALGAAASRRADFASRFHAGNALALPEKKVDAADANTPYGNVYSVIENGVETPVHQELLSRLLAHGVARALPDQVDQVQALAAHLIWLAAHTPCNALEFVDEALGDRAGQVWEAV